MKSRPTRTYDSPTRKEHAELTRQKIIEALIDLLVEEQPATISIPAVARRATVSVRTVYHHFPTKEALFDALPEASRTHGGATDLPEPSSPKEMASVVHEAFEYFERNGPLFNAMRLSEASERVRPQLDRRAVERADKAVSSLVDAVDTDDLERLRSLLGALVSYDTFRALTRRYGLSVDEASETVAWAVRVLGDRAKRTGKVGGTSD